MCACFVFSPHVIMVYVVCPVSRCGMHDAACVGLVGCVTCSVWVVKHGSGGGS